MKHAGTHEYSELYKERERENSVCDALHDRLICMRCIVDDRRTTMTKTKRTIVHTCVIRETRKDVCATASYTVAISGVPW